MWPISALFVELVGVAGFEPATPSSRTVANYSVRGRISPYSATYSRLKMPDFPNQTPLAPTRANTAHRIIGFVGAPTRAASMPDGRRARSNLLAFEGLPCRKRVACNCRHSPEMPGKQREQTATWCDMNETRQRALSVDIVTDLALAGLRWRGLATRSRAASGTRPTGNTTGLRGASLY